MKFFDRLSGKKTYLLAAGILVAVVALGFFGKLTPGALATILTLAIPGFAATFRAAIEQHHEEEMTLLEDLGLAASDMAAKNYAGAGSELVKVAAEGGTLCSEISAEQAAAAPAPAPVGFGEVPR